TLETWFPDRARRARDIDLVVRDPECEPDSAPASALLSQISQSMKAALEAVGVRVLHDAIPIDAIWTYERAEGRRISIPWLYAGSLKDAIQVDVVFREPLQDRPALEAIRPAIESGGYRDATPALWFASRAES